MRLSFFADHEKFCSPEKADRLHRRIGPVQTGHAGAHLGAQGAARPSCSSTLTGSMCRLIAGMSRSNFLFRLYDGAIKSAQIVEFLKGLRSHWKRKLLIIWDGAAQHKSRVLRAYLDSARGAIQMALLPGYAPDLAERSHFVPSAWAMHTRHRAVARCVVVVSRYTRRIGHYFRPVTNALALSMEVGRWFAGEVARMLG